jgi:LL-diaminopimelate aminotransferase
LDELKALARKEGLDLIDLGMGNPDGAARVQLSKRPFKLLKPPNFTVIHPLKEPPVSEKRSLNGMIAAYGVELNPDNEALPLLGSKEGLSHLALAYVNPGDVVLVPSPAYPAHFRGPLIAGATLYPIILKAEQDWLMNIDCIPEDVAKQAKILYFNYPSNPTTCRCPPEFFEKIVASAKHYEIMLVHDLCYAELSFDGYQPTSLLEIPGQKRLVWNFIPSQKPIIWLGGASVLSWAIPILFKGYAP